MADIRDVRDNTVATLRRAGMSGAQAEAAGRRLEQHLTRKEQGLPVSDRPSIINDRRRG